MRIATLGPEGTFSHEASLKYGKSSPISFANTIRDVFGLVADGKADIGIVPVENSIAGTIGQTLDLLLDYKLMIKAEEIMPISHNLVGFGRASEIKVLYLHPQTYEQCEIFIKKNFPKAEILQTSSNGRSAEIVANAKDKSKASIIPKIAASIYKLKILKRDVQDSRFNVTRFFAIGRNDGKKTGYDRTSIAIYPQADRPGLLHEMLGEFAKRRINLTKIESRPSKGKLGDYVFFIDFQGHRAEKNSADALKNLEKNFFVKILGSYPRKY
ncbi:prephenate dehydratase [Candidatus Woesearchaeota archaeon]|nr:prephenate dehydratase [Candidatus Woesearchaeota archaeon]